MEHRHLGRSGMVVSAISYGNWITHGNQVEEDAAAACVRAALDAGITTFDTADVYANGAAEEVLGRALHGVRRDSIEIFTKVYWPTGPNPNNRGLSRKHIIESAEASLRRLGTDHVDLLQAHRYDNETPLEETLRAFDDLVRAGKVHYIGVSEWTADQIADAVRIADQMGLDRIVSNQPQYSLLWRVIEPEVVPLSPASTRRAPPFRRARAPCPAMRTSCRGCCATRSSAPSPSSLPWSKNPDSPRRPWRSPGCCATPTWPRRSSVRAAPSRSWRT
jgi:aryl-alcohol dehydrogenase-like predicted oxidoreductase